MPLSTLPVVAAPLSGIVTDASPFQQTKKWSCWAAAAVILMRWRNKIPISEADVAKLAGPAFQQAFVDDTGLNGQDIAKFAAALGLVAEAPQNFSPAGYHDLVKKHGPIWVGARLDKGTDRSRRHVRVLKGVTGDGTFAGSTAWVLDPGTGKMAQPPVKQFATELEEIAKEELGAGNELFPQIIRFA